MNSDYINTQKIAQTIYNSTCRTSFDEDGFCLVDLGDFASSSDFRALMVDIKEEMAKIYLSKTNETLIYFNACRFNQQDSTKPHLDGGEERSVLMLGYEPSEVDSTLEIVDFSKCAYDLGISPKEFLDRYNPMFVANEEILRPYATPLLSFDKNSFSILCINNSYAPYSKDRTNWQGVLHRADIPNPCISKTRMINSTMIVPASKGSSDRLSHEEIDNFIRS